jgi:hypothetical protein
MVYRLILKGRRAPFYRRELFFRFRHVPLCGFWHPEGRQRLTELEIKL